MGTATRAGTGGGATGDRAAAGRGDAAVLPRALRGAATIDAARRPRPRRRAPAGRAAAPLRRGSGQPLRP